MAVKGRILLQLRINKHIVYKQINSVQLGKAVFITEYSIKSILLSCSLETGSDWLIQAMRESIILKGYYLLQIFMSI